MKRKIIFLIGLGLAIYGLVFLVQINIVNSVRPKIVEIPTQGVQAPTVTKTPTPYKIEPEIGVSVIVPVPIATQLVKQFVLSELVDLSSGSPVALTIRLADGELLSSNWAGAVSFQEEDNQAIVFQPYQGIIYTYSGDVMTTWAHSGISKYGQMYFATNFDLFIRKTNEGQKISLIEGVDKLESLKGLSAYLCQDESGKIERLSDFDASVSCSGKQVELEIVAVALVQHDRVDEYTDVVTDLNGWLINNYPEAGFDQLDQGNGWLVRFCIGLFPDQVSDGTESYLYNAGVIGFKVLNGE